LLQLKNITKVYSTGGTDVLALGGVDLSFRESEFVCVLGPSGCGKTTLLNIIGGLDHYTDGDLIINGRSTKDYRDADWDAYRNHSIGFVFQNYNLIPHQSVAANVELALTLSGVSKAERAARARAVLERVGLGDQIRKKPNQLSGGQMQRVAIARALINDPDILLADEPTGALDSDTSIQVMEILKEISQEKLIIMVTHNPELAERYSTRTVRLLDGRVISDTDAVTEPEAEAPSAASARPSMSFFTALTLSFTNLLTKKFRTALTAFAGSIGIIGIALILSLSNGLKSYINETERNTLSSYPLMIESDTVDFSGLLGAFSGSDIFEEHPLDRVYTNTFVAKMMNTFTGGVRHNDLGAFKAHIEANEEELSRYTTAISYSYSVPMRLYREMPEGGIERVSPGLMSERFTAGASSMRPEGVGSGGIGSSSSMVTGGTTMGGQQMAEMWRPLISNTAFLSEQYEVVAGSIPDDYSEAALIITERNEIPDIMLYSLGLKTEADLEALMMSAMRGEQVNDSSSSYSYEEILALEYAIIPRHSQFEKSGDGWEDKSEDEAFMKALAEGADRIKITGILRPKAGAAAVAADVYIGYTEALTRRIITATNEAKIVKAQIEDPDTDVFTGLPFIAPEPIKFRTMDEIIAYINSIPDPAERQETASGIEQAQALGMGDEQLIAMANNMLAAATPKTDATYEGNLERLELADLDTPTAINIYASSFENKDAVTDFISRYNRTLPEGAEITYTDYIGLLLSSVTVVINAISVVLIAFVSISLVVSSIMIGIITYISVLERTREIGVLRAIGASKRDIARVFNAETLIVGFSAGVLGIAVTALLCIPANSIVYALTDIPRVAILPAAGAVALVLISMLLTLVAGLLPSRIAARKDPVTALRSE
jgi:putative ABC transport system permease protein